MAASFGGISARGWLKLASWTVFGTLGCLVVSLGYNWIIFSPLGPEALRHGMVSATVLPIILAGPLFFLLSLKLRELAIANHRLSDLASLDGLTGCLNRRAFTDRTERRMSAGGGALLVVDADHFKAINDSFGHDRGDEALRLIAAAIRSVLRSDDAVGRLGGEEFGIYLAAAGRASAAEIAERIRAAVAAVVFIPAGGKRHPLSVSVGCAVHERPAGFRELFGLADQNLYAAKKQGRNRIGLTAVPAIAPGADDLVAAR